MGLRMLAELKDEGRNEEECGGFFSLNENDYTERLLGLGWPSRFLFTLMTGFISASLNLVI